jgi:Flp pilus assembly protein TadG
MTPRAFLPRSLRLAGCLRDRRGIAAVEFALVFPVMMLFLGGVVDFGLAYYGQSCLANAVAAGAEYAVVTGTGVSNTSIQSMVQAVGGLTGAGGASQVVATVTGPACYCVAGTTMTSASSSPCNAPPSTTSPVAGSSCTGSGTYGTYVIINATYTFHGILSNYSKLATAQIKDSATVQLQ